VARARELLSAEAGRPFVLEAVAKQVLALYGVPVSKEAVVHDAAEAARAAEALGGPVALKALSYALPHKSDQGGLRLGVSGGADAAKAYLELVATLTGPGRGLELQGVLVQQMVPATIEIMCGLERDPVFGPVVAAGLGGALVEVLGDPVLLRAPFTLIEAERAAAAIAGGRITHPVRGLDDGQLTALAEAMVGIGTMAVELPEVASADVNPFRVSGTGFCAVDALLVVSGAGP
jgi:succinyl-CoA synthetase beta subunit